MLTFPYRVSGSETTTHVPETLGDLDGFYAFLDRMAGQVIGLDTETTGLHIFGRTFGCRLVQFGNTSEAWVIRVDLFANVLRRVLADPARRYVAHNAPFDLLVLDRTGLATLADLGPRVFDTYILAHLIDPRPKADGGAGLKLKELSTIYVDPDAADTQDGLNAVFLSLYREWKKTVSAEVIAEWERRHPRRPHIAWGFTNIDIAHPLYLTYAGLDVIYVSRLLKELGTLIKGSNLSKLATWEHRVQLVTTAMQKRGLLIDVDYAQRLAGELAEERARRLKTAAAYGVESVYSVAQIREALIGMGEEWTAKTDSGALSVGKEALLPMADLEARDWTRLDLRDPNPLADAIVRAKRAKQWGENYAQAFLDLRDESDRIHPFIKSLAARTARMSVTGPPLQQLPSSDWTVRRAIITAPGEVIGGIDYKSMELRVLAALANVKEMKRAIVEGRDLHDFTASLIYGDNFTKGQRRYAKGVGLGKVFGGGAAGLARQIGAPLADVQHAVKRYDEVYPEVSAYSKALQRQARWGAQEVVTPFGRHLPLDRDRAYACVNYAVQSTARDLIAKALLAVEDAGLGEYVLLPVHDELIVTAPKADADEVVRTIGRLMESTFMGVAIESDPEVYGPSWGSGYGCPPEEDYAA